MSDSKEVLPSGFTVNFFSSEYTFICTRQIEDQTYPLGHVIHAPELSEQADGLEHFLLKELRYLEDGDEHRLHYMAYAITAEEASQPELPEEKSQVEEVATSPVIRLVKN